MPTSQQIMIIKDELRKAFDNIAKEMPKFNVIPGNRDAIAYELFVAQFLFKCAETRKDKAMESAIEANVIFDHKSNPSNDTGTRNLYNSELLSVDVEVKNGSARVDPKAFAAELIKRKVDIATVHAAQAAATKRSANPHTFTATLNMSGVGNE